VFGVLQILLLAVEEFFAEFLLDLGVVDDFLDFFAIDDFRGDVVDGLLVEHE